MGPTDCRLGNISPDPLESHSVLPCILLPRNPAGGPSGMQHSLLGLLNEWVEECLACCLLFSSFPGGSDGKEPTARWDTRVQPLDQQDPLEKRTHSSILAWRIPWTEEPGGLQSIGSQRVRHKWATNTFACFLHVDLFREIALWL